MRLHRYVRVEMIKCAVRLFAPIPTTLVHALNLFIAATRALVLLSSGNGHERVHLLPELVSAPLEKCLVGFSPGRVAHPRSSEAGPERGQGVGMAQASHVEEGNRPSLDREVGAAACCSRGLEGDSLGAYPDLEGHKENREGRLG